MFLSTVEKELLNITRRLYYNTRILLPRTELLTRADEADKNNNTWLASNLTGQWFSHQSSFDYEEHNRLCRRAKQIREELSPSKATFINEYAEMTYLLM